MTERLGLTARLVATGLGSGYSPVAPGTAGSFLCAVLAWFLVPETTAADPMLNIAAHAVSLAAFAALAVWASDRAQAVYGHDASRIVVDEFAGYLVAIFLLPKTLLVAVAAFLLFRVLDVVKPFPARRAESLPGGLGIVTDDLVAGVYANLLVRLMLLVRGG
ncbi:MAG: phosphatidylglycerophosphatase A [Candidatus Eisenbacteria bacterium]|nr:phosphatidylglycerophosphatase A [Candidatus Eisenbacteria bacterium]